MHILAATAMDEVKKVRKLSVTPLQQNIHNERLR